MHVNLLQVQAYGILSLKFQTKNLLSLQFNVENFNTLTKNLLMKALFWLWNILRQNLLKKLLISKRYVIDKEGSLDIDRMKPRVNNEHPDRLSLHAKVGIEVK